MLNTRKRLFESFLICIFFLETFLGGGGDIFSFHFMGIRLTLRMVISLVLLLRYLIFFVWKTTKLDSLSSTIYILFAYNLFSFLVGSFYNGFGVAWNDLKSTLFLVLFLPITSLKVNRYSSFKIFYTILLISASIISTVSITIFSLIQLGYIDIYQFRLILDSFASDTWLRNSGAFIYPSHVYLIIASIFILFKNFYKNISFLEKILFIFFALPILISNTRGLIITYIFSMLISIISLILSKKIRIRQLLIMVTMILLILILTRGVDFSRLLSLADQVDGRRITFIREGLIEFSLNPISVLFGRGYGLSLPSTGSLDLEISLFEILIEQGLFGLGIWLTFIFLSVWKIRNYIISKSISYFIGTSAIISIMSIFILSFTNPYLNNSVGILMIFILILIIEHERSIIKGGTKLRNSNRNL